jgi:hypothetical protein
MGLDQSKCCCDVQKFSKAKSTIPEEDFSVGVVPLGSVAETTSHLPKFRVLLRVLWSESSITIT